MSGSTQEQGMSAETSTNVVVVRGRVTRPPAVRELPAGGTVAQLEVTTVDPASGRGRVVVPVAWDDPGPLPQEGTDVVVTGYVRRRFFRVASGTQSRTEVVAEAVVPWRSKAKVRQAVAAAVEAITIDAGSTTAGARPG